MKLVYPWSAVVGQEALKQALLLCAIDPAIGGVLLSGPRGIAKTTLARALGELTHGPFVELPLGATDDRVVGTLDLASALRDGKVVFSPGLLARAHGGVLYVDEVNLLPDTLVDLLLDAATSGQNSVERDGVSHSHPARFVLIGTMNPDEGELRPQLTDRFGLSVETFDELLPEERAQIVTRRIAFDHDPQAFRAQFASEQHALIERCQRARALALTLPLEGPALERVTALCYAARVEGVRADLAMLRAARAHAAWHEHTQVTVEDVDAVAELALAHRRRREPEPDPSGTRGGSGDGGSSSGSPQRSPGSGATGPAAAPRSHAQERASPRARAPSSRPDTRGTNARASTGALAPVPVRATATPKLPSWLVEPRAQRSEARRRGTGQRRAARGRAAASAASDPQSRSVDWFRTLARAPAGAVRRLTDLQFRERRAPGKQHWVLALDCSASMLRGGALAAAKGVAHAFEASALRVGAHLSVLSFRGTTARLEAGSGATRHTRERSIRALCGGGGTPLGAALRAAIEVCRRRPFQARDVGKRVLLLTDGRTREPLSELRPPALARPGTELELVVIDCERGPVRLGRAAILARAVGGQYLHIDSLFCDQAPDKLRSGAARTHPRGLTVRVRESR